MMQHAKPKVPWNDPGIGRRAAAFVDRMPGRFYYPRSLSLGILPHKVNAWRKGKRPKMPELFKLAAKGADLHYILTGKRIWE